MKDRQATQEEKRTNYKKKETNKMKKTNQIRNFRTKKRGSSLEGGVVGRKKDL